VDAPLPPLRQELRIEPGTPLPGGAPGFILFDPLRHLFFQIGALEQRVLALWRHQSPVVVRDALVAEGETVEDAEAAIADVHRFVLTNSLTRDVPGAAARSFAAREAAARKSWWKWLLDHYLFIRIPLIRPAAFLQRTLPIVRPIWSRAGIAVLALLALAGLFLISREWDGFTGQFANLASMKGVIAYIAALAVVKCFHELGHAYTATRYGVRVPTMGISFLVMVPVPYTDTSGAWRLRRKAERIRIDMAGVAAEMSVAAIALFLWPFLPDGTPRTAAFVLATTSIATSLFVNASPFMRYDGYYILADLLGVPNLASRAFALMRWRLRELLFGLGEAPPEPMPAGLNRLMSGYAVFTFLYRASLYIGIALLVYHKFFKALGIVLFAVEVCVFLARPVLSELREWRARSSAILSSRRARITALLAGAALVAGFLPLDRSVSLPAVLKPIADKPLVPGDPGRVERILVNNGQSVVAGQPLLLLSSPDIALGEAQARLRIAQLQSQIARGVADTQDLTDATVLQHDLLTQQQALAGFAARRAALTVRAPFDGKVVDLPQTLAVGSWVDGRAPLLRIVQPGRYDVRAYADESEGWRLEPGAIGRFVPDDAGSGAWSVKLDEVGASAIPVLDQPVLAQANGGPIATTPDEHHQPVPAHALIVVHLIAEQGHPAGFPSAIAGRVHVAARGESIAHRVARAIGKVLAREDSVS
jgi:putative peptide zinc metalloprotease protein